MGGVMMGPEGGGELGIGMEEVRMGKWRRRDEWEWGRGSWINAKRWGCYISLMGL